MKSVKLNLTKQQLCNLSELDNLAKQLCGLKLQISDSGIPTQDFTVETNNPNGIQVLNTDTCYFKDAQDALKTKNIHVANKSASLELFRILDPNVKKVLLQHGLGYLDTGEVSANLYKTSNVTGWFSGNTDIEYFDEFEYSVGVEYCPISMFKNCTNLKQIRLPKEITRIHGTPAGQFENCTNLKSIYLNCVKRTANSAFKATNIKEVRIKSIDDYCRIWTHIGNSAVNGQEALLKDMAQSDTCIPLVGGNAKLILDSTNELITEITVPYHEDALYLGAYLFYRCNGLESITVSEGHTYIPRYFCYWCKDLKHIILPSTVTTIMSNAFERCENVETIVMPQNIQTVESYAFWHNDNANFEIPSSIITIGDRAFGYTKIEELNLTNCTSIGKASFENCKNLKTVTLGPNVKTLDGTFWKCDNLNEINLDYVETITGGNYYTSYPTARYDYMGAFGGCVSLPAVLNIPNATTIGPHSFVGCTSITNINSPKLTSVGEYAFDGCTNLSAITTSNVKTIDYCAFRNCSKLTSISAPNLETIGSYAFYTCYGLSSFTGLNNIKSIGEFALQGAKIEEELTLPNYTATSIPRCAFVGNKINISKIPDSVTTIGQGAFSSCPNITTIDLNNVTTINNGIALLVGNQNAGAFAGCTSLVTVKAPNLTSIGGFTFYNCTNLQHFDFDFRTITGINDYVFNNCTKLNQEIDFYNILGIRYGGCYNTGITGDFYAPNVNVNGSDRQVCGLRLSKFNKILNYKQIGDAENWAVNYFYMPNLELLVMKTNKLRLTTQSFYNRTQHLHGTSLDNLFTFICPEEGIPTIAYSATYWPNPSYTNVYVPAASIDAFKADAQWKYYANRTYAIGGTEWTAQFGCSHHLAHLLGTIAERNGHLVITLDNGTVIDGNHQPTECVDPARVVNIVEKYTLE